MTNFKTTFFLATLTIGISSCSTFPSSNIAPGYQEAFTTIRNYIRDDHESIITKDLIDGIPYASSSLKIGNGPKGLIILESKVGNQYTWVSADGVYLVIENGRIIQTTGLVNNLINLEDSFKKENFLDSFSEEKLYKYYQSYDDPPLNNMELEVTIRKEGKELVDIFGKKMELQIYSETKINRYIGWRVKNLYWVDDDLFIWKSEQYISPKIPKILIEVTKKPSL
jgi:hypothetical protein